MAARQELKEDIPSSGPAVGDLEEAAWHRTCFFSAPIGDSGTMERRHSDVFLESLVKPAIETVDPSMKVVRADQLSSGLITASVYEYVIRSRLMVADISFHNANVLHEVGMRHLTGKPCVLISRTDDDIPANLQEIRFVRVNTSEVFEFQEQLPARCREIASYASWALSGHGSSPLQRLFPDFQDHVGSHPHKGF